MIVHLIAYYRKSQIEICESSFLQLFKSSIAANSDMYQAIA